MERKGSTKGLAKKELERLMDLSECAMFTAKKGPDIDVCYANKKFYSLLQYTQQEFEEKYGKRLMDVIVPEEKQKIRKKMGLCTIVLHLILQSRNMPWMRFIMQKGRQN